MPRKAPKVQIFPEAISMEISDTSNDEYQSSLFSFETQSPKSSMEISGVQVNDEVIAVLSNTIEKLKGDIAG